MLLCTETISYGSAWRTYTCLKHAHCRSLLVVDFAGPIYGLTSIDLVSSLCCIDLQSKTHDVTLRGIKVAMAHQSSKFNYDPYRQTTTSSDPSLSVTAGPRSQERRSTATQYNVQLNDPFATLSPGESQENGIHPSRYYYPPAIAPPPDSTDRNSNTFDNLYLSTPYGVETNLDIKSRGATPGASGDTWSIRHNTGHNTASVATGYESNPNTRMPPFQSPSTMLQPLLFSPSPSPQSPSPPEGINARAVVASTIDDENASAQNRAMTHQPATRSNIPAQVSVVETPGRNKQLQDLLDEVESKYPAKTKRACIRCHNLKTKCSSSKPCQRCEKDGVTCREK
jgi:hypothetical protein